MTKIWKTDVSLQQMNERGKHTLAEHVGIEFIEIGDDYLVARMPVDYRVHQPLGIMNGGASCVLAETVGSTAGNYAVDPEKNYCVGLDINTNHIKAVRNGDVIGTARPYHLGKKTQVWSIEIRNESGQLVSVSRLTLAVIDKA